VRFGETILKQHADAYRRLRNTFRFLLGNLFDFTPGRDDVPAAEMDPLDRWALSRLQRVVETSGEAFETYDFHRATQAILLFCTTDLSAFYLDVLKDRLYTSLPDNPRRRSSQTAMHEIASVLCRLLAPVLVHTTEEVWAALPVARAKAESVHLTDWPVVREEFADAALEERFGHLLRVRDEFNRQLEAARAAGTLNKSLEAWPTIRLGAGAYAALVPLEATLREALMAPKLTLLEDAALSAEEVQVSLVPAPGRKCERSWFVLEDVGSDPDYPTISAHQAAIVRELERRSKID
jgi:isoleucyl-tRNA synthetase